MGGARTTSWIASVLLGAAVFCWTAAGETSNPLLPAHALPHAILNECGPAVCAPEHEFRANWVGRTARGNLFVVSRSVCEPGRCSHWLIEKDDTRAHALLELPAAFRFHRVTGRYPTIEFDSPHHDHSLRMRFEWNGSAYARTRAQRIYEVNGVECGTRDECHAIAEGALKANDVDRAQRIWQQVHGVSWI